MLSMVHAIVLALSYVASAGAEWKLLLVGGVRCVGVLPLCGEVYCIQRLVIIPLTTESTPEILGLEVPSMKITVTNVVCLVSSGV